jgi:hypothetical protein
LQRTTEFEFFPLCPYHLQELIQRWYWILIQPICGVEESMQREPQYYLAREKKIAADGPAGAQVVLVSTSSLKRLCTAFPNDHLDTDVFIKGLRFAIK